MSIDRRSLLKRTAALPFMSMASGLAQAADQTAGSDQPAGTALPASSEKADYTLRIATGLVELAPDHIVSTTLYNGQFPGPLLRFTEGRRVIVDIYNDTDTPELVHWHGQIDPQRCRRRGRGRHALHPGARHAPDRLHA